LQYITKLSNSEFQIIAKNETLSVKDLEGKKVNCFKKLSSTQLACDKVFKLLKINIQQLNLDQEEASSKLKSGEIDAFVRYAGAPHGAAVRQSDGLCSCLAWEEARAFPKSAACADTLRGPREHSKES